MKPDQFCFWLQGLFELGDIEELDAKQTECIKKHLNLVFLHSIDPELDASSLSSPLALNGVHSGMKPGSKTNPNERPRC